MPVRWKDPAYNKRYGPLHPYSVETYKTRPDLFETDLPGPSSRAAAPTLNENTTVNKRAGGAHPNQPAAKVAHTSSGEPSLPVGSSLSSDVNMSSLPGTGKEMADIGHDQSGMDMVYHIEKPLSIFENRDNIYKKSHKFMTFGLAPNIIPFTIGEGTATITDNWLTTYLAEIPWHIPALYMNQGEFNNLDEGAQVKSVEIEVYYRGSTIQFATASSATNLATLNQLNDIAVAHGLNRSGQGSNVSYTSFNATQTMVPTGIALPKYDAVGTNYRGMLQDYYGTNNDDSNFPNYIPHHQVGRQTFLYNYWALSARSNPSPGLASRYQFGGWPVLQDKIQQMDGKTAVNMCVVKSHYKPKMGMLTTPLKNIGHGLPTSNSTSSTLGVPNGGHLTNQRQSNIVATNTPTSSSGQQLSNTEINFPVANTGGITPTFDLFTPIEKSQWTRTGSWGETDPHIQPSIHIGVQPVPALTTSATLTSSLEDGAWTDVRAYWEVIATMHTKEHDPTAYPWSTIPNVPVGDVIYYNPAVNRNATAGNARQDGATWQALYTDTSVTLGPDLV